MHMQNFVNARGTKDTSGKKICAYLGLNIVMGTSPHRHQYKDYWRDDDFLGRASFKTVMTRDRYAKLDTVPLFN